MLMVDPRSRRAESLDGARRRHGQHVWPRRGRSRHA